MSSVDMVGKEFDIFKKILIISSTTDLQHDLRELPGLKILWLINSWWSVTCWEHMVSPLPVYCSNSKLTMNSWYI